MEQKTAGIRIAPYAIAIVYFILPFVQLSCEGEKMISFTGVQLVTGTEIRGLVWGGGSKQSHLIGTR